MDTAGQERFKSINASYCRKADCCLLVYDISNLASFNDCKSYFNQLIKDKCKKDIQVVLLGNKTDLENKRKVPPEDGANFSLQNNYIFMETSCLKNENVADYMNCEIVANDDGISWSFASLWEKTYKLRWDYNSKK